MTVVERIGQVGSLVIAFFCQSTLASVIDAVALAIMIAALALYYAGWIRYLVLGRAERSLYSSLLGILVPIAVVRVICFLSASVLPGSIWLMLAAVMLGVSQTSVTWLHSGSIE